MSDNFYSYALLATSSVLRSVQQHYDLAGLERCKFYARGLHDNYLLESQQQKYILRVYRNAWRTEEAIRFELDLLRYLGQRGASVSYPISTTSGASCFSIVTPIDRHFAALFPYADGQAPGNAFSVAESLLLGNTVAQIHAASDDFSSAYTRPSLDLAFLVDASIASIAPFVDAAYLTYLKQLQARLQQNLPQIPRRQGRYGICIGDVNPTNFHINPQQQITVFDFDQCGFGDRAFEIGKFISGIHLHDKKQELAQAFMEGYQQVRLLSPDERSAIPYYEMVGVIWVMAITAEYADLFGHKWIEAYWERKLALLKTLESQLFKD